MSHSGRSALAVLLICLLALAPLPAAAQSATANPPGAPPDCVGYSCTQLASGTTQLWGSFPFGVGTGSSIQFYAGDRLSNATARIVLVGTAQADWTWVHTIGHPRIGFACQDTGQYTEGEVPTNVPLDLAWDLTCSHFAISGYSWYGGPVSVTWTVWYRQPAQAPRRQIVFVHGINGNARDIRRADGSLGGYVPLLSQLSDTFGAANIAVFSYYQDIAYANLTDPTNPAAGGPCDQASAASIPDPGTLQTGPLFISGGGGMVMCDSKPALAYNAAMLDDLVNQTAAPATVIAHSMGGATVRGWLRLAQSGQRPNDQSAAIVDSIITEQGAQEGSWLGLLGNGLDTLDTTFNSWQTSSSGQVAASVGRSFIDGVVRGLAKNAGFDSQRPAIRDLTPQSSWYQNVNPYPVLGGIHYYNFYSEEYVNLGYNVMGVHFDAPTSLDVGDLIMLPGDPSPTAMPAGGGARFLPGGPSVDRYEYRVPGGTHHVYYDANVADIIADKVQGSTPLDAIGDVVNDPANHLHFNDALGGQPAGINSVSIASCGAGQPSTTALQEILRIVQNPSGACQ